VLRSSVDQRRFITRVAEDVFREHGATVEYEVGLMIAVLAPRCRPVKLRRQRTLSPLAQMP